MFGTSVLVKGLLIQAIIEWTIGIRGIMLTLNLKKKIGKNILSEKKKTCIVIEYVKMIEMS
jgi:hypothetical protein